MDLKKKKKKSKKSLVKNGKLSHFLVAKCFILFSSYKLLTDGPPELDKIISWPHPYSLQPILEVTLWPAAKLTQKIIFGAENAKTKSWSQNYEIWPSAKPIQCLFLCKSGQGSCGQFCHSNTINSTKWFVCLNHQACTTQWLWLIIIIIK